MKRLYRSFLIAFLAVCTSPAMADRVIRVEPGLWEYTHTLSIPGLLTPSAKPKTECIKPGDAKRQLSDLLGELSGEAGCTITNLKSSLNMVKFDLSCDRSIEAVSLKSSGHMAFKYGRTKITGSATGTISLNGAEMDVAATGAAHRVGRCKN